MIFVVVVEIEIEMITKQTQTGGSAPLHTALRTIYLGKVTFPNNRNCYASEQYQDGPC